MEDHGGAGWTHGGHGHLHHPATLAYAAWVEPPLAPFSGVEQLSECFSTASELRQALLSALAELDAARAAHRVELRQVECEAARLVASAAAERDELRRHCHSLLLLLHHHTLTPPTQSQSLPEPLHAIVLGEGGGSGERVYVMDEQKFADAATSEEPELQMALSRRLPEKGRLVEAVVSAGPLLQTLLLAGPLPQWRHPPPPAPADIPPFNPHHPSADAVNQSFSSASSSPESNCSGGGLHAASTQQHALPCLGVSSYSA